MTHRFSAAPTALGSSSIDSQPFRAGLTFCGRPSPGFPVELGGFGELHAPFFMERRTRGSLQCSVAGNPGPGLGLNRPDCQSLLRTLCGSYSKREPQTSPFVKARRAVPKNVSPALPGWVRIPMIASAVGAAPIHRHSPEPSRLV